MELTTTTYKETEFGRIPSDWDMVPLAKLGKFGKGKGIRKDQVVPFGIPCVRYGELYSTYENLITEVVSYIGEETAGTSLMGNYGDILFAGSGETRDEIGKSAALLMDGVYVGGDVVILRPRDADPVFLGYLLNGSIATRQKSISGQGDAVVHIYPAGLAKISVPVPHTLEEQQAIASALSDTDALIAKLEQLIAKKKAIKQGAMQELLRPKEGWVRRVLGKIGLTYGGLSGKSKGDFDNGNYPYVTFLNVMTNTVVDPVDVGYVRIDSGEHQNNVRPGDLLFNTSSETPEEVGMCAVLLEDVGTLYLNSFCFGFRLQSESDLDGLFLSYLINSPVGREHFLSLAQGATRYNLSKKNFNKVEILVPELREQKAIAATLSDMEAEIVGLESKAEKLKHLKVGMMQELLTGKTRLL